MSKLPYQPQPLSDATRALLKQVTTATLSMQLRKRGLYTIYIQGVQALNPAASHFVGPAFTLRYIPMREDITRPEVYSSPDYPQREAIENTPAGHVLVIDSRGDLRTGMAGDILLKRLQVRGVAAVVADGPMRDCAEIVKLGFPVFCAGGAAPPSMNGHHAVGLQEPIACGGVAVLSGDILVGDADGVVVIPSNLADEVARDAVEQEDYESWVQEQVGTGRSTAGIYPATEASMREYEAARRREKC